MKTKAKATKPTSEELHKQIESMDYEACGSFLRFAKSEHPIIQSAEAFAHLKNRFSDFGGWNPELSKKIGWAS